MNKVSPAATYACLLPDIMEAGRECGYAIAVHGSMARDLDLIAVPWVEEAKSAEALIMRLLSVTGGHLKDGWSPVFEDGVRVKDEAGKEKWDKVQGDEPADKPHGRRAWSIHLGRHANLYLDVSVMPRIERKESDGN